MKNNNPAGKKTEHSRLLQMVEEIEDYAILTLDRDGNIVNWNKGAEKIKGYNAAEIIGKNFRLFYSAEDLQNQHPDQLIQIAIKDGKVSDEGWRIRKNGTRFWASVVINAIYDETGEVIGFVKVTRDLTSKMLADKALKKHAHDLEVKNKELEQFVYIASHDLQEPLLTVQNFVDLLQEEYGDRFDEDARMYFSYITQSTLRMQNLIKGLLDYSRIGRKKILSEIFIDQLLDIVCLDLKVRIDYAGAEITYRNMPIIMGYEIELRQLFQNLISNAVKFRKRDVAPRVDITARSIADGWEFAVKDNGIGIAPEHADKIFLIFQRLNNREAYEGSGIGLANCKKIAEMHNGTIWVESAPGQGSTFYFTIQI